MTKLPLIGAHRMKTAMLQKMIHRLQGRMVLKKDQILKRIYMKKG